MKKVLIGLLAISSLSVLADDFGSSKLRATIIEGLGEYTGISVVQNPYVNTSNHYNPRYYLKTSSNKNKICKDLGLGKFVRSIGTDTGYADYAISYGYHLSMTGSGENVEINNSSSSKGIKVITQIFCAKNRSQARQLYKKVVRESKNKDE